MFDLKALYYAGLNPTILHRPKFKSILILPPLYRNMIYPFLITKQKPKLKTTTISFVFNLLFGSPGKKKKKITFWFFNLDITLGAKQIIFL